LRANNGWDQLIAAIDDELRPRARDIQQRVDELLSIYEDSQVGESNIYKRYKQLLQSQPEWSEFQDWFQKLRHYYEGAIVPIKAEYCLMPDDKDAIDSSGCQHLSDEVFIKVARVAQAYLVSEGGNADKCRNGHSPPVCALDYMRRVMRLTCLSVEDTIHELQQFRQRVSL
jgi:hypothetical protein